MYTIQCNNYNSVNRFQALSDLCTKCSLLTCKQSCDTVQVTSPSEVPQVFSMSMSSCMHVNQSHFEYSPVSTTCGHCTTDGSYILSSSCVDVKNQGNVKKSVKSTDNTWYTTLPENQSSDKNCHVFGHLKRGLHVINLNIQHILPKLNELKLILQQTRSVSILGLCETFLLMILMIWLSKYRASTLKGKIEMPWVVGVFFSM